MDEAEVEIVAEELARLGGASWNPGQERGPILRLVHERYRDRARAAIAALDRYRGRAGKGTGPEEAPRAPDGQAAVTVSSGPSEVGLGDMVLYRPPGDRRSYPCVVEKISGSFVYLVPQDRTGIGWVSLSDLLRSASVHDLHAGKENGDERAHSTMLE